MGVIFQICISIAARSGKSIIDVSKYENPLLQKAANDLINAKGNSLVVAGGNDKNIHLIVNAINDLLGNFGSTINFTKNLISNKVTTRMLLLY